MKQIIFLLLTIFLVINIKAQKLIEHIPDDVAVVGEINIPEILETLPLSEFESSEAGKMLLKNLSKTLNKELTSIREIGISTEESMYFFINLESNQMVMSFIMALEDPSILETYMEDSGKEIVRNDKYNTVNMKSMTDIYWNRTMVNIVSVESQLDGEYMENSEQTAPNFIFPAPKPISQSASFKKHDDDDAALGFWLGDLGRDIIKFGKMAGPEAALALSSQGTASVYDDYKDVSLNLFFEEEKTCLHTKVQYSKELGKSMKKITKSSYNKDFFKYVDLKDCIFYLSNNVSVENLLTEYPELLKKQIKPMMNNRGMGLEFEMGVQLFSTVIDEEAIGELIRGDLLFVANDLKEVEVEYTDYEYDSNFNEVEVVRTKMEQIPSFIAMASTKEGRITDLSTALLEKYKLIQNTGSFYRVPSGKELPFDLYYLIKDDIVFIGTSKEQFEGIANGTFNAKVPSEIKKHIKKNPQAIYLGLSEVNEKIFGDNPKSSGGFLSSNSPNVFITTSKIRNTSTTGSLSITTPDGYENGLKYMLSLIDGILK